MFDFIEKEKKLYLNLWWKFEEPVLLKAADLGYSNDITLSQESQRSQSLLVPLQTVSQTNTNAEAKIAKALNLSVAGIDPITCSSFLESVRSETYPVHFRDPNRETLPDGTFNHTSFTRMTLTENPFWISVHHRMADRVRWTMYREGTYYEKALEKLWKGILKESGPGARILDVGYVLLVTLVYGLNIECLCCVHYRPACAGIDVE
jgi:hypothetical protein